MHYLKIINFFFVLKSDSDFLIQIHSYQRADLTPLHYNTS